MSEFLFNQGF